MYPLRVLTSSRKVDECKSLPNGRRRYSPTCNPTFNLSTYPTSSPATPSRHSTARDRKAAAAAGAAEAGVGAVAAGAAAAAGVGTERGSLAKRSGVNIMEVFGIYPSERRGSI